MYIVHSFMFLPQKAKIKTFVMAIYEKYQIFYHYSSFLLCGIAIFLLNGQESSQKQCLCGSSVYIPNILVQYFFLVLTVAQVSSHDTDHRQ